MCSFQGELENFRNGLVSGFELMKSISYTGILEDETNLINKYQYPAGPTTLEDEIKAE